MSKRALFLLFGLLGAFTDNAAFAATPGAGGRTIQLQHLLVTAPAGSNHTSSDSADSHALGYASDMGLAYMGSVQCSWASLTGTINATVQVNISDDKGAHWVAKSSGLISLSGASGSAYVPFAQTPEQLYQAVYTAGTVTGGTVDCWLVGK